MSNMDDFYRVEGLSINDETLITGGELNPSVDGYEAPLGSLYLRTNVVEAGVENTGLLYIKIGAADTAWTEAGNKEFDKLVDIVQVPEADRVDGAKYVRVWDATAKKFKDQKHSLGAVIDFDYQLGNLIHAIEDHSKSIYQCSGQTITDAKLAAYLTEHPIAGFTVTGNDVKTANLKGRYVGGSDGLGVSSTPGATASSTNKSHRHYVRATNAFTESGIGRANGTASGVDSGRLHPWTNSEGSSYARPETVGMPLCIVGGRTMEANVVAGPHSDDRVWYDSTIKELRKVSDDSIVPTGEEAFKEFDPTKDYKKGASIVKDGVAYRTDTAIAAGAWDVSSWIQIGILEPTTVGEYVRKKSADGTYSWSPITLMSGGSAILMDHKYYAADHYSHSDTDWHPTDITPAFTLTKGEEYRISAKTFVYIYNEAREFHLRIRKVGTTTWEIIDDSIHRDRNAETHAAEFTLHNTSIYVATETASFEVSIWCRNTVTTGHWFRAKQPEGHEKDKVTVVRLNGMSIIGSVHGHDNPDELAKIGENAEGKLTYNGTIVDTDTHVDLTPYRTSADQTTIDNAQNVEISKKVNAVAVYTKTEVDNKVNDRVKKSGDNMTGALTFTDPGQAMAYTECKYTPTSFTFKTTTGLDLESDNVIRLKGDSIVFDASPVTLGYQDTTAYLAEAGPKSILSKEQIEAYIASTSYTKAAVDASQAAQDTKIAANETQIANLANLIAGDNDVAGVTWDEATRTLTITKEDASVSTFVIGDQMLGLVDELTSNDGSKALSAKQGKILREMIEAQAIANSESYLVQVDWNEATRELTVSKGDSSTKTVITKTEVVDNTTATDSDKALSVNQGTILRTDVNNRLRTNALDTDQQHVKGSVRFDHRTHNGHFVDIVGDNGLVRTQKYNGLRGEFTGNSLEFKTPYSKNIRFEMTTGAAGGLTVEGNVPFGYKPSQSASHYALLEPWSYITREYVESSKTCLITNGSGELKSTYNWICVGTEVKKDNLPEGHSSSFKTSGYSEVSLVNMLPLGSHLNVSLSVMLNTMAVDNSPVRTYVGFKFYDRDKNVMYSQDVSRLGHIKLTQDIAAGDTVIHFEPAQSSIYTGSEKGGIIYFGEYPDSNGNLYQHFSKYMDKQLWNSVDVNTATGEITLLNPVSATFGARLIGKTTGTELSQYGTGSGTYNYSILNGTQIVDGTGWKQYTGMLQGRHPSICNIYGSTESKIWPDAAYVSPLYLLNYAADTTVSTYWTGSCMEFVDDGSIEAGKLGHNNEGKLTYNGTIVDTDTHVDLTPYRTSVEQDAIDNASRNASGWQNGSPWNETFVFKTNDVVYVKSENKFYKRTTDATGPSETSFFMAFPDWTEVNKQPTDYVKDTNGFSSNQKLGGDVLLLRDPMSSSEIHGVNHTKAPIQAQELSSEIVILGNSRVKKEGGTANNLKMTGTPTTSSTYASDADAVNAVNDFLGHGTDVVNNNTLKRYVRSTTYSKGQVDAFNAGLNTLIADKASTDDVNNAILTLNDKNTAQDAQITNLANLIAGDNDVAGVTWDEATRTLTITKEDATTSTFVIGDQMVAIVDDGRTNDATKALSAKQGALLNTRVDNKVSKTGDTMSGPLINVTDGNTILIRPATSTGEALYRVGKHDNAAIGWIGYTPAAGDALRVSAVNELHLRASNGVTGGVKIFADAVTQHVTGDISHANWYGYYRNGTLVGWTGLGHGSNHLFISAKTQSIYVQSEKQEIVLNTKEVGKTSRLKWATGTTTNYDAWSIESSIMPKKWIADRDWDVDAKTGQKLPLRHERDYIQSAKELMINGSGQFGNTYNWYGAYSDSITVTSENDLPNGVHSCFKSTRTSDTIRSKELILLNGSDYIKADGFIKVKRPDDAGVLIYSGLVPYDVDEKFIESRHVYSSGHIVLTQPIAAGDTVIHFDPAQSSTYKTTSAYACGFAFFGEYADSRGHVYEDYTRYLETGLWADGHTAINDATGEITLANPIAAGSRLIGKAVGAKLWQSYSGGTFQYFVDTSVYLKESQGWVSSVGEMKGFSKKDQPTYLHHTKIRAGTHSFVSLLLSNYGSPDAETYWTGVKFSTVEKHNHPNLPDLNTIALVDDTFSFHGQKYTKEALVWDGKFATTNGQDLPTSWIKMQTKNGARNDENFVTISADKKSIVVNGTFSRVEIRFSKRFGSNRWRTGWARITEENKGWTLNVSDKQIGSYSSSESGQATGSIQISAVDVNPGTNPIYHFEMKSESAGSKLYNSKDGWSEEHLVIVAYK